MESKQLYQEIVEQTPDAIIFADPKGIIRLRKKVMELERMLKERDHV